jgi:hypothetical protein
MSLQTCGIGDRKVLICGAETCRILAYANINMSMLAQQLHDFLKGCLGSSAKLSLSFRRIAP